MITMHRAKGCEFDDVYLSGWEEGIFPHSRAMIDEERRLAFVAITRARRQVAITYAARRRTPESDGKLIAREPSRFLRELRDANDQGGNIKVESKGILPGVKPKIANGWMQMLEDRRRVAGNAGVRMLGNPAAAAAAAAAAAERSEKMSSSVDEIDGNGYRSIESITEETKGSQSVSGSDSQGNERSRTEKPKEAAGKPERSEGASPAPAPPSLASARSLLSSLSLGSVPASSAKSSFKSMLSSLGVTRGNCYVTDKGGNRSKRALSRCTARQLGEYAVQILEGRSERESD